jgi:hypothetical protein
MTLVLPRHIPSKLQQKKDINKYGQRTAFVKLSNVALG